MKSTLTLILTPASCSFCYLRTSQIVRTCPPPSRGIAPRASTFCGFPPVCPMKTKSGLTPLKYATSRSDILLYRSTCDMKKHSCDQRSGSNETTAAEKNFDVVWYTVGTYCIPMRCSCALVGCWFSTTVSRQPSLYPNIFPVAPFPLASLPRHLSIHR